MGKKSKPSIGERIINALTWWRSPKEKESDLPNPINKNTSPPSSSSRNTDTVSSSSLKFSLSKSCKDNIEQSPHGVSAHGSITGDTTVQSFTQYIDPTQLLSASSPVIGATPPDQTEFFSFLDDVIAGKHNELLKDMNQRATPALSNNGSHLVESNNTPDPQTPSGKVTLQQQEEQEPLNEESKKRETSQNQWVPTKPPKGLCSSAARTLMNYELMAYLGRGTFAEVTLARHKDTHKLFALKKISKKKVREEGCVQRTFTERQLLASLRHPFLVSLHQAFQSRTHLYLVLDFAQGGDFYFFLEKKPWVREMKHRLHKLRRRSSFAELTSLKASSLRGEKPKTGRLTRSASLTQLHEISFIPRVRDDSRTPIRLIAFYAVEVALVLQYLHEQGFIYRDLKPENILLMRSGHLVLTDFGVAKYRGVGNKPSKQGNDRKNSFTGTTQYMSPEMLLGQPHDSRIDWWSFGCLLFEMTTGRRPFAGENQYAVVQSIVERDVCILPEDFLLTGLEVDTRVMQLHRRHRSYQRAVLQDMTQRAYNNTIGDENGLQFCGSLTGTAMSTGEPPNLFQGTTPDLNNFSSLRNESLLGGNESFASAGAETVIPSSSMTLEENSQYLRYAVRELEEASMLLRDLILLLLERRPERRLGGVSVLEHPFFTCSYVTSQLYYKAPRFSMEEKSSNLTANTGGKNTMNFGTPQNKMTSEGCSYALKQMKSISPLTMSVGIPGNDEKDDDMDDKGNDCSWVSQVLQKHLSAEFFLSLSPYERPENWRDLFLKKRIKPLFTPRLLATDDLCYFPAAVTATGDSIVVQQRTLREQTRRRHESLSHSFEYGNNSSCALPVSTRSANTSRNMDNSVYEDTDILQASLSSLTTSDEEYEEPLQPSVPRKPSHLPSFLEKENTSLTQHQKGETDNIPFNELEMRKQDSADPTIPTNSFVSSMPFVSSTSGSLAYPMSSTMQYDETKYKNDTGKVEGKDSNRMVSTSTSLLPLREREVEIARPSTSGITINKGETIETKNVPITSLAGSIQKENADQCIDKMSIKTNIPMEHVTSETFLLSTSDTGVLKKSNLYCFEERGRLSSSSLFSQSTTDDDEGILYMAPDSGEKLPDTLCGIAYDVDDYLPNYSKRSAGVLQSSTGIPSRKMSKKTRGDDLLVGKEEVSEAPIAKKIVASDFCDTTENKKEISDNHRDEKLDQGRTCTSLRFSTTPDLRGPASVQRGGGGGGSAAANCFTTMDTRRISNLSLFSPRFTFCASPNSPGEGTSDSAGTREVNASQDSVITFGVSPRTGDLDERASSQFFDNSSLLGTGGAQHYLGFTFDARNGHALLLGGIGNSSSDTGAFSDLT
ncbi:serine/threonine protein kinase [Trypanosoma theileri]|uniref:non-specific serine/threonine protein kinase n=1 Tax=Trypanosoma theileri TaxID=67003 RepID=A0A1X0P8W7_9TRYP|nr:serine/threonine protein kinase [Trypanosoma theileri]ORC93372.1 serine/threonine protein kinase [Trypanosoma theileri]